MIYYKYIVNIYNREYININIVNRYDPYISFISSYLYIFNVCLIFQFQILNQNKHNYYLIINNYIPKMNFFMQNFQKQVFFLKNVKHF